MDTTSNKRKAEDEVLTPESKVAKVDLTGDDEVVEKEPLKDTLFSDVTVSYTHKDYFKIKAYWVTLNAILEASRDECARRSESFVGYNMDLKEEPILLIKGFKDTAIHPNSPLTEEACTMARTLVSALNAYDPDHLLRAVKHDDFGSVHVYEFDNDDMTTVGGATVWLEDTDYPMLLAKDAIINALSCAAEEEALREDADGKDVYPEGTPGAEDDEDVFIFRKGTDGEVVMAKASPFFPRMKRAVMEFKKLLKGMEA